MSKDNTQEYLKPPKSVELEIKSTVLRPLSSKFIEISQNAEKGAWKPSTLDEAGKITENYINQAWQRLERIINSEVRQVLDRLESQTFGIKQDIPVSQYPARSVNEPEYVSAINQVISKSAIEAERKLYE